MVEAEPALTENVCGSCGSPIGPQAAFCDWCGSPIPPTVATLPTVTKPPSLWRRVITGGIALLFLVPAGFLFFIAATTNDHDYDIVFFFAGLAATFFGLPFAIATVIPFGPIRRVVVGLGVGLFGFVFFGGLTVLAGPLGLIFALPIAAAFGYFGYRIAR